METRSCQAASKPTRGRSPRGWAHWRSRKAAPGAVAAVDARLRAMAQDVERWPIPQTLLKALDDPDETQQGARKG